MNYKEPKTDKVIEFMKRGPQYKIKGGIAELDMYNLFLEINTQYKNLSHHYTDGTQNHTKVITDKLYVFVANRLHTFQKDVEISREDLKAMIETAHSYINNLIWLIFE